MTIRDLARRFFAVPGERNSLTITGPRKSGPPYVDHHTNRTKPADILGTPRPTIEPADPPAPPQPRTWHVVNGEGYVMGVATEDPDHYIVTVTWHPCYKDRLANARARWVDYTAFRDDITDTSRMGIAYLHRIPSPIRVRSRDEDEAAMQDRQRRGLAW